MNYRELSKADREVVSRITDDEVASDPGVADAMTSYDDALHVCDQAREVLCKCRDRIDLARKQVTGYEQAVAAIDSERPTLAGRVLRGEARDEEDRDQQRKRADAVRRIELQQLAI